MSTTLIIVVTTDNPEKYFLIPTTTPSELELLWDLQHADLTQDVLTDKLEMQLKLFEAALGAEYYSHLPTYDKWIDNEVKMPLINMTINHVFSIVYPD